jgi:hypothetical protein
MYVTPDGASVMGSSLLGLKMAVGATEARIFSLLARERDHPTARRSVSIHPSEFPKEVMRWKTLFWSCGGVFGLLV